MHKPRPTALALVLLAFLATTPLAEAGGTLATVQARGVLRCGVSEGISGFSQPDTAGRWTGLDADFCRAVAAAVLGDGERVEFVQLRSSARFPALQARRIDLLARNATWTLTREAVLGVQFPAILLYDGQGFLVPAAAGVTSAKQLNGAQVCVEKGTTHTANLARYAKGQGLSLTPRVLDSAQEVADAFFAGRCAAYSSDASQLAAARLAAPGGPGAYVILPERISKEPLAPVVWGGDPQWTTVVRWVLYALILAEEDGTTQSNIAARLVQGEGLTAWLSGEEFKLLGKAMGLPSGWGARAVKAVGNYGEVYERNLGTGSPLQIERGLNRLWNQGGLMYAPPID
jgi:general L-amino acid transport system substrate-binding protein